MIETTQLQPATMPWETVAPARVVPRPALSPSPAVPRPAAKRIDFTLHRHQLLEIALDQTWELGSLPPEAATALRSSFIDPQEEAVKRGVGNPISLASMLLQCGDLEGARNAITQAPAGQYWTEHMRAMWFWQSGDLKNAEEILRTLSSKDLHDPRPLHALSKLLAEQERFRDAIVLLEGAVKNDPDSPSLLNDLGALLIAVGEHRSALQTLRSAVRTAPRYALALANCGVAHLQLKHNVKAVDYFRRALKVDPRCEVAVHNLAEFLLAQRNWEGAADLLQDHVLECPRNVRAQALLAWCFISSHRLRDAQRVLETASRLVDHKEPSLLSNLATVYAMLREYPRAQSAFHSAMLLAPEDSQIRANCAHFLATHDAWPEVVQVLRVIDVDGVPDRAALLANALLMCDAPEDAVKLLRLARERFRELRFELMLGHALASRVGRPAEAIEVYREAIKAHDDELLLNNLGYALILAEQLDDARDVLEPLYARQRDRSDVTALCAIGSYGLLKIRLGQYSEGMALYREAHHRASGPLRPRIKQKMNVEEGRHHLETGNLKKARAALNSARSGSDVEFSAQAEQLLASMLD